VLVYPVAPQAYDINCWEIRVPLPRPSHAIGGGVNVTWSQRVTEGPGGRVITGSASPFDEEVPA